MNNNVSGTLRAIVQNIDNTISQLLDKYRAANNEWSDDCYECFIGNSNTIIQIGERFSMQVETATSQIDNAISTINSAVQQLDYV